MSEARIFFRIPGHSSPWPMLLLLPAGMSYSTRRIISLRTSYSFRHSITTSARVSVCENSWPARLCFRVASRKRALSLSPPLPLDFPFAKAPPYSGRLGKFHPANLDQQLFHLLLRVFERENYLVWLRPTGIGRLQSHPGGPMRTRFSALLAAIVVLNASPFAAPA